MKGSGWKRGRKRTEGERDAPRGVRRMKRMKEDASSLEEKNEERV